MAGSLDNLLDTVKSIFNFDVVRRLFFLSGIALSAVVGLGVYNWIKEPIYRPLSYNINQKNLNQTLQLLEKNHIKYKYNEYTRTISVPISDISKAKMAMFRSGINDHDDFSFSYLNDLGKIGSSQFLENARYIRALESDLAKTISEIQGVNAAKVHLAIPQNNIFLDENSKPSASVVVNIMPGQDSKEKIRAIVQIVSASVPDLDPSRVAITDQYGHDLSFYLDKNSFFNQENLDYQKNLQRYYEQKIQNIISPILGRNKASINVNISLDFTQTEVAKEEYDPDNKIIRSEQSITEENGGGGNGQAQVPGALANAPPANQGNANQANNAGKGQTRSENIKNYEITKSMHYVKNSSPKIENISVAVVVDNEKVLSKKTNKMESQPLGKEKIEKLQELIKSTIGYNKDRGDQVTVVNSGFIPEKIEPIPHKAFWQEPWFWEWSKYVGGILIGLVFLLFFYRKYYKELSPNQKETLPKAMVDADGNSITPDMLALKTEQIKIIRELVAKEPNKVAGIIKKWITK